MLRGAISLFAGGLMGKLLGVFREGLLAYLYGTSEVAAANRMAQTAVLSPLNLVTTDALSGAFLPHEARLRKDDHARAVALYRVVRVGLICIGLVFASGSILLGQQFVGILAPELDASFVDLTVSMVVAMAVGAPFYLYYNIAGYFAMANADYRISGVRASGQSVGLIIGIVAGYSLGRPSMLAWGFTAAYALMAAWAVARIRRRGYLSSDVVTGSLSTRDALATAKPFLKSASVLIWMPLFSQSVIITEKIEASDVGVDAVAAVDYARIISDTGILLLAVPIGLASLPTFAILAEAEFRARLAALTRPLLALAVLCGSLLYLLAGPLVQLLFGRGEFGESSVAITSSIVRGLSVGIGALLLSYVLTKALNARGANIQAILSVGVAAVVTIVARPFLVDTYGAAGLGKAVSIGAVFGALTAALLAGVVLSLLRGLLVLSPTLATIFAASALIPDGTSSALAASVCVAAVWCMNVLLNRELREAVMAMTRTGMRRRASKQGYMGRHRKPEVPTHAGEQNLRGSL